MGFHGRAAAHKPKITMRNAKLRLEGYKVRCHWTLEQWKSVFWSDESASPKDESGFGECQENTTCPKV